MDSVVSPFASFPLVWGALLVVIGVTALRGLDGPGPLRVGGELLRSLATFSLGYMAIMLGVAVAVLGSSPDTGLRRAAEHAGVAPFVCAWALAGTVALAIASTAARSVRRHPVTRERCVDTERAPYRVSAPRPIVIPPPSVLETEEVEITVASYGWIVIALGGALLVTAMVIKRG
jgi:hypothetical protein